MTATESRYERLDAIERRLAQRPDGWTTGELARELGVNPSTIYRGALTGSHPVFAPGED